MIRGDSLATQPGSRRLALAVALLFGLTSIATLAVPARSLAWDGNAFDAAQEAQLIALTNRSRASAGLKALKVDPALTSIARWRSQDMIQNDYFSHDIPGYGKVFKKLDESGYCYRLAGENIGWNTYPDDQATAAIHQMFMDSSGHRDNILGSSWDAIGVGPTRAPDDKKMWTVLFADTCGASSTPAPTPKPTPKPAPKPTPRRPPSRLPSRRPDPPPGQPRSQRPLEPTSTTPTPRPADTDALARQRRPRPDDPGGDRHADADAGARRLRHPRPEPTPMPDISPLRLRVVESSSSRTLLDMIVTGVTGFFFGA